MMVRNAGMATMTERCTFALDEATTARIRRLAALWHVSQAEVIRRAVSLAESPPAKPDPAEQLRKLLASGEGLKETAAKEYMAEVRANRKHWRPS
jgi:hypothetical protein